MGDVVTVPGRSGLWRGQAAGGDGGVECEVDSVRERQEDYDGQHGKQTEDRCQRYHSLLHSSMILDFVSRS